MAEPSRFTPLVSEEDLAAVLRMENDGALFDFLSTPLLEELYRRQDWDFFEDLNQGQKLILAYAYFETQMKQGGFLQLIANSYSPLILDVFEGFEYIKSAPMMELMSDALEVITLNSDDLLREISIKELPHLYEEYKEFEILDSKFDELADAAVSDMAAYAREHLEEFVKLGD